MKITPRKNCIICLMEIHRSPNSSGLKQRRAENWLTCSKKCSKTYKRIQNYLRVRINKLNKKRNLKGNYGKK